MKKRVVSLLMICALSVGMLAGCGSSETQNQATGSADNTQTAGTETVAETKTPEVADDANLTATQQIIKQAEGMTMEELAQKAIEESNGKTFYGVGNSSRGKAALPLCHLGFDLITILDQGHCEGSFRLQGISGQLFKDLVVLRLLPVKFHAVRRIDRLQILNKQG